MTVLFYCLAALVVLVGMLGPMLYWDKGRRSLVLALRSLWLHKMRSFLSVLGIIIGTGAVIALMSFGEGSMHDALEDIKRMGATNIIIRSVKPAEDSSTQQRSRVSIYGLTLHDYERLQVLLRGGTATRLVPMRIFNRQIRYVASTFNGRVAGTTPEYAVVNQLDMAVGRFLREEDDRQMRNVCVLGASTAASLFPFSNPLGDSVKLDNYYYVVVGVVKPRMPTGGSGGSQSAEDFNNDVYIPLSTCNARFGETIMTRQAGSMQREQVALTQITMTVADIDKVRSAGEIVKDLLQDHPQQDWALTIPLDRLEEAERTQARYMVLLAIIASISLLVGGIGIMNIMLATVTERTREIGIRRALGAKRRDITLQFLVEAVVQTSVGGVWGVVMGLNIVFVVPPLIRLVFSANMPARVHVPSIFLALGVAILVGVGFGLYPAWRASRLDPIEALRHE